LALTGVPYHRSHPRGLVIPLEPLLVSANVGVRAGAARMLFRAVVAAAAVVAVVAVQLTPLLEFTASVDLSVLVNEWHCPDHRLEAGREFLGAGES